MSMRHPPPTRVGPWVCTLLLLGACSDSAGLEQIQQQNIRLIRQLQAELNRQDWSAARRLYADEVLYKGPATHHQPVLQSPAKVIGASRGHRLEILQLYAAYEHHVVVEGRVGQEEPSQPVCIIYTVQEGRITRQSSY